MSFKTKLAYQMQECQLFMQDTNKIYGTPPKEYGQYLRSKKSKSKKKRK